MPLYEYQCERCRKVFEVRQKFSDEPLTVHPDCGGEVLRLISPSAFQFKGSGWYVTDYGRGGHSKDASASNGKPESTSDKKTESKPESKTESKTESKPASSTSSTSEKK